MTKQINVYDEVTGRIIAELESGTAPWVRPWDAKQAATFGAGGELPYNATTGRHYSGINVILLWMFGPPGVPAYLTYKQAEAAKAQVRGGSKGYRIVYADRHTKRIVDDTGNETDETVTYQFLKRHTVFHVSQVDGLPDKFKGQPAQQYAKLDDAAFNLWIDNTGADIKPGGVKACYWPTYDQIGMPPLQAFKSAEDYKATLLHELVHWTGHKSRLDRVHGGRGSHDYAREELIAEMGAAFLCARLGVTGKLQHAEYLASWIKCLKADNRAIFRAAAGAQRAADYLFSLQTYKPVPRNRSLVPVRELCGGRV